MTAEPHASKGIIVVPVHKVWTDALGEDDVEPRDQMFSVARIETVFSYNDEETAIVLSAEAVFYTTVRFADLVRLIEASQ